MMQFLSENLVSIIVAFIPTFISGIFAFISTRQARKLDKEVEKYKHQLQTEFLKAEIKTKQLFSIYPELFRKIKYAEGEFSKVYGPIKRQRNINQKDIDNAFNIGSEARDYLYVNLLFISEPTKLFVNEIFDVFCKIDKASEEDCNKIFEEIGVKCALLETQMRKELANESQETQKKIGLLSKRKA